MSSLSERFGLDGYLIEPDVVTQPEVDALLTALAPRSTEGLRGGVRHILRDVPEVRTLAESIGMRRIADAAVGAGAHPVRGILFDKSPGANWKVIWHQDLTIAVDARRDVDGFGPWSEKDGAPHVQPPTALLQSMIAVRLHLDDCTSDNGPVRVLPGSHREGRLTPRRIDEWRQQTAEVECVVPAGGVLAFHSLLLHASSPARTPSHRRVIHIEYVGSAWRRLPGGLQWQEAPERS